MMWNLSFLTLDTLSYDYPRALCLKFPKKYSLLMNFLASTLRDEVCAWYVNLLALTSFREGWL